MESKIINWIRDEAIYPNCSDSVKITYNDDNVLTINILSGTNKPSSGLNRIYNEYAKCTNKPIIKSDITYFKVILPNLNYMFDEEIHSVLKEKNNFGLYNAKNDAKKDAKNLEEFLIELITTNNKVSKIEMARLSSKSKATIERALKKSSRIVHCGPKNGGYWKIIE